MPHVIGRAVHLHPVVTIFAVLIGLEVFGVLGGLLGVPAARRSTSSTASSTVCRRPRPHRPRPRPHRRPRPGRTRAGGRMMLESLDYVYVPSRDVAAESGRLRGRHLADALVFAIEGMGTRVAMIELTEGPPRIVLAGHLEGDRPILVYRVADLAAAENGRSTGPRLAAEATTSRSRRAPSAPSRLRAASGSRSTSWPGRA